MYYALSITKPKNTPRNKKFLQCTNKDIPVYLYLTKSYQALLLISQPGTETEALYRNVCFHVCMVCGYRISQHDNDRVDGPVETIHRDNYGDLPMQWL